MQVEQIAQQSKLLDREQYIKHLEAKLKWRRADNPPLLEGQYLVKKMNKYGAVQHSVNLYYPGFGWVMIKDGFSVVEWMQIPGINEGDSIA